MKIGFINLLYSKKDDRGGLGSHIQDLSSELSELGHDVTILTSGKRREYREGSVKVIQLGEVPRYWHRWQILNPYYVFQRFLYMVKLVTMVRRCGFDVVEAAEGGFEHLFLILFRPCPLITKLHGNFRYIYGRSFLLPLIERLERFVVSRSDGIYASSAAYAEKLSLDYQVPREKIRIIPYGIRIHQLYEHNGLQNLSEEYPELKTGKIVFLSVGSSPVRKGAPVFLDAAAQLKHRNIHFLLGCSDKNFISRVRIPENVLVLDHLEKSRFYSVLSAADLVVFPSSFESFSIATHEAMLLSKTIVVSQNLPLEGSARNYSRCMVLARVHAEDLSRCITDFLEDKVTMSLIDSKLLDQMKEELDIRNVAQSTVTYYKEIVQSHSASKRVN